LGRGHYFDGWNGIKRLTAGCLVQPSSPRGNKRDRRTLDGDSSDEENNKDEEGDAVVKKSKLSASTDEAGSEPAKDDTAAKEPVGRKKVNGDNQKNGIVKASKESKKAEEEPSPKRKRGRPKGSGNKAKQAAVLASGSASKAQKQEEAKGQKQPVESTVAEKVVSDKSGKKDFVKLDGEGATKIGSGREKVHYPAKCTFQKTRPCQ
jgi:hypothetical protein